jgi:putative endonuclease
MYFVYILECGDGSLYTSITTDLKRRLGEHQAGKGGHFTRSRKVLSMVFTEEHPNRSSALKREAEIKRWPRAKKFSLINSLRTKSV